MLKILVVNDWIHMSSGLVLEDGRRMKNRMSLFEGTFVGR